MAKVEVTDVLAPEVIAEIDKEIDVSLEKENVTELILNGLEEKYMNLSIKNQEDKEGYLAVVAARKDCKSWRVLATKICKKGREEANARSAKWIDREKRVVNRISKVEDLLENMEKAYEAENARQKAEREAKIEQQGISRMADMVRMGAQLMGSNWVLGDVVYEAVLVKSCDDDIYKGIFDDFHAQFNEIEKVRLQKEADQRQEQEKLRQDQEELKKMQQEAKNTRTQGRISYLESLGMTRTWKPEYVYGDVSVFLSDIEEKDAQDWEVLISGVKEKIENAKIEEGKLKAKILKDKEDEKRWRARLNQLKDISWDGQGAFPKWGEDAGYIFGYDELINLSDQEFNNRRDAHNDKADEIAEEVQKKETAIRQQELENARLEGIGKERRNTLLSINVTVDPSDLQLGSLSEDKWNLLYFDFKSKYDKKQKEAADKAEEDRKELLGEKGKYEELVAAYKAINIPAFKSGQYRAKVNIIRDFIDGLK